MKGSAHGEGATGPCGEGAVLLDGDSAYPSVRGKGEGWESPDNIGLRDGHVVEVGFVGLACASCRVEGVEHCPVGEANIEGEEMVGTIAPGPQHIGIADGSSYEARGEKWCGRVHRWGASPRRSILSISYCCRREMEGSIPNVRKKPTRQSCT